MAWVQSRHSVTRPGAFANTYTYDSYGKLTASGNAYQPVPIHGT